jgi:protein O-GlcNAc transferase
MNPQLQLSLQQAIQAFQEGNFDSAERLLKRILQVDTKNLPALHILGLIKASQACYREAADYLARAARIHPDDASIQYNLAKALADSGNDKDALTHHKKAVALSPNNPEAWLNYGKSASNLGRYEDALVCYDKAFTLKPDYAEALLNKGANLKDLGRYEEALVCAEQALSINPHLAEAWSNKGGVLQALKRYDEAIAHYDKALSLKPELAEVWSSKAIALYELNRIDDAIAHYEKALSINPDSYGTWSNLGVALQKLKHFDEAIASYDKALTLNPAHLEALVSKGVALQKLKHFDEAVALYKKALSLNPNSYEALSNTGLVMHELRHFNEAIANYDKALRLKPDSHEDWSNKAAALQALKQYDEAIEHYRRALSLNPDVDWIYGDMLHAKMKISSWSNLTESLDEISQKVLSNEKVITPFNLLALNDDAVLHKKSAETYAENKYPENHSLGKISKRQSQEKIRVGYFSADFRNHAVSILTAELFELHDKNKFEIVAFSSGVDDKSPMRSRLRNAFNQFIDVSGMSDLAIAKLSREMHIDIAVDLGGYTADNRPGIFAYRAAPTQISYIGYLGTTGAGYYDYLLADKIIVPEGSEHLYSEKIAYLPSYQVNDRKRAISTRQFSRSELGLPESGFVYCCFNNNYKITPSTFDSWMKILKATDGSVLFLYAENEWAETNLKKEAGARGVDGARLIFGKSIPPNEYLARYRACDLFIDTFPYNAGTTASDALWAGLPVLTLQGQSFASRMAASLLNAIGLPELITNTQAAYETLAIDLAKHPEKLEIINRKLAENRLKEPLFDTPLFTKNLEDLYIKLNEESNAS